MVQQVREPTAEPEDPGSIPGTLGVEGTELTDSCKLSSDLCMHTCTHNKCHFIIKRLKHCNRHEKYLARG